MSTFVVVSAAYRVVEASSPMAAVTKDARENPRRGAGVDVVVVTKDEAEVLLRRLVHVQVSPNVFKKKKAPKKRAAKKRATS